MALFWLTVTSIDAVSDRKARFGGRCNQYDNCKHSAISISSLMMIRPIAICIFRHNGRILTAEYYDAVKQQYFYRPLGGGIEFGEYSRDTIVREIGEEMGTAVTNLCYLGILENIFIHEGKPGHEIVQVYDGEFVDKDLYDSPTLTGFEDNGEMFTAVWKPLSDFLSENAPPLYPDGLIDLLNANKEI